MGILDFFKYTPPKEYPIDIFVPVYLKGEEHITEIFGNLGASGFLDELKLDYDLFAKHFKAIQMTLLLAVISQLEIEKMNYLAAKVGNVVREFDMKIWELCENQYQEAYLSGKISGIVENLNNKLFKNKLNEKKKENFKNIFNAVQNKMDDVKEGFI